MQDIFPNRIRMFQVILIITTSMFVLKLAHIQLVDDKNRLKSKDNAIKEIFLYPNRGQVYDRNGKLILHNQNIYEIMVTPLEVKDDLDVTMLCNDLGIDTVFYNEQMKKANKTSLYRPFVLVKHIPNKHYQRFQEHIFKYNGFYGQIRSVRSYPYPVAALLFGTIGEVDSTMIEKSEDFKYYSGDYIGKSGIELSYEKYLRGIRGVKVVLVDAMNRIKGSYAEGDNDMDPIAGDDLVSSIDIDLQQLGEQLLGHKSGSVVAIEPKTGEVLALCSGPNFDPNLLTGINRNKYFSELLLNKYKPMYNRAIQGAYPPGSTFKAMIGLVSLQMGAIQPNFTYYCPGYYSIGRKVLKCSHRHAPCRSIIEGLTQSCNPYFFQTFRNAIEVKNSKSVQYDYDRWRKNIIRFGLNKKTGIDLINEKQGYVPDTGYYNRMYRSHWKPTTVISLGIGQGEILMTPIQMANAYSVIANKGYYITPHIIKEIRKNGKNILNKEHIHKVEVPIDKRFYDYTIEGLEKVVTIGTARRAKIEGIVLCGKTGTSQNPHGKDHSIFIGFAPKDNPKIVVACVIENGGSGGSIAAPIVSLMIEKYLKKELSASRMSQVNGISSIHLNNFKINEADSLHIQ